MRPAAEQYDAVIVGSGFGGAMVAQSLAAAGFRVVVLERGVWPWRDDADWSPHQVIVRNRYGASAPLWVRQYRQRRFRPLWPTAVVGGLSVIFGGAAMRLRSTDFAHWPFSYADLEPYYARAERLLGIHGAVDAAAWEPPRSGPFPHAPGELNAPAQRLHDAALRLGYSPSRLPLAINVHDASRPRCAECTTCDGFPCKLGAKNDVAEAVLRPAMGAGLEVADQVTVAQLRLERGAVRSVVCCDESDGTQFEVRGRVVVVAAGALHTPTILLRSGLGQEGDAAFLGRFLMRHCNIVVCALFPFATNPEGAFHKQLCFAQFYEDLRHELGTATGVIQDISTPTPEVIRHFAPRGLGRPASLFAHLLQNLLCVAEDEPQADNRVVLGAARDALGLPVAMVTHRYSRRDLVRRRYLVVRARRILRGAGGWPVWSMPIETFSHALGTVRCSDSPATGALDPDCRYWGVDNLYVADASFMPTSGGVNPSLTIAANALRVAEAIVAGGSGAR